MGFKKKFISLKKAAKISDYHPDYIGWLIRKGKIEGRRVFLGVCWQTTKEGILEYKNRKTGYRFQQRRAQGKEFPKCPQEFISLKEAAEISGYAPDYIGWLIRKGKIPGKKLYNGAFWQTTEKSLKQYLLARRGGIKQTGGQGLEREKEARLSIGLKAGEYLQRITAGILGLLSGELNFFRGFNIKIHNIFRMERRFSFAALFIFFLIFFGFFSVKFFQDLVGPIFAQEIKPINVYPASYRILPSIGQVNWQNPEAAFVQDIGNLAAFGEFNAENSAFITAGIQPIETVTSPQDGVALEVKSSLEFFDFGIHEEVKVNGIKNAQLRFSFAASPLGETTLNETRNNAKLEIEYQSDGDWQQAGEIIIDEEISNALNGGYFLYGLPVFENWSDLENLKIRFTYAVNQKILSKIKNPAINGTSDESQNDSIHSALTSAYIIANQETLSSPPLSFRNLSRGPAGNRTPEILMSGQNSNHSRPTADLLYQNKTLGQFIWQKTKNFFKGFTVHAQEDVPRQFSDTNEVRSVSRGLAVFLDAVWLETEYQKNHPPIAKIDITPSEPIAGEQIYFDGSQSLDDVGITSYHWDLGDGAVIDGNIVAYSYSEKGDYEITLIVSDGKLSGSTTTVINVAEREEAEEAGGGGEGGASGEGEAEDFGKELKEKLGELKEKLLEAEEPEEEVSEESLESESEQPEPELEETEELPEETEEELEEGAEEELEEEMEEEPEEETKIKEKSKIKIKEGSLIFPQQENKKTFRSNENPFFVIFEPEISVQDLINSGKAEVIGTVTPVTEGVVDLTAEPDSSPASENLAGAERCRKAPGFAFQEFAFKGFRAIKEFFSKAFAFLAQGVKKMASISAIEAQVNGAQSIKIRTFDPKDREVFLNPQIIPRLIGGKQSFEIKLQKPERKFRPGKWRMEIEMETKEAVFVAEQEFTWGVLAINVNKSIYLPNETAYLQMAALDDNGHTICGARLRLQILNPKSEILNLSTEDGTIQYSGECGADNVTDVPDYFAYYELPKATQRETDAKQGRETPKDSLRDPTGQADAKPEQVGIYQMKLINLDNGYEIEDSFEVRESVPFEVERVGPTRIYPPATYEMKFKIKANQDFVGEVIEYVPESFDIIPDSSFQILDSKIIWQVDWKAGETYELKYQFDAPDISPYLYLLGPLEFYE